MWSLTCKAPVSDLCGRGVRKAAALRNDEDGVVSDRTQGIPHWRGEEKLGARTQIFGAPERGGGRVRCERKLREAQIGTPNSAEPFLSIIIFNGGSYHRHAPRGRSPRVLHRGGARRGKDPSLAPLSSIHCLPARPLKARRVIVFAALAAKNSIVSRKDRADGRQARGRSGGTVGGGACGGGRARGA